MKSILIYCLRLTFICFRLRINFIYLWPPIGYSFIRCFPLNWLSMFWGNLIATATGQRSSYGYFWLPFVIIVFVWCLETFGLLTCFNPSEKVFDSDALNWWLVSHSIETDSEIDNSKTVFWNLMGSNLEKIKSEQSSLNLDGVWVELRAYRKKSLNFSQPLNFKCNCGFCVWKRDPGKEKKQWINVDYIKCIKLI